MRKPSLRKLLVSFIGLAAVSYVVACDNNKANAPPPTAGNLEATPSQDADASDASVAPVATTTGVPLTPGVTPNGGLERKPVDPSTVPNPPMKTSPTPSPVGK